MLYQHIEVLTEYMQWTGFMLPVRADYYIKVRSFVNGTEQAITLGTFNFIYATGEQL
jgi:hypothetical protein